MNHLPNITFKNDRKTNTNMWCLQDKTNAKIWLSQVFIQAYVCF